MLRISNLRIAPPFSVDNLKAKAAMQLGVSENTISEFRLYKSSIDARKKSDIFYLCSVDISLPNEDRFLLLKDVSPLPAQEPIQLVSLISSSAARTGADVQNVKSPPPIIIGSGPAGLMAGLVLAKAGLRPILLERGKAVEDRRKDVESFRKTGILNVESNVQFGEGGAGTFSDGKLTTGIHDPRIRYVLDTFTEHGAPEEIRYSSKPHIGTDLLVSMVQGIRNEILRHGGEIRFGHKLSGLVIRDNKLQAVRVSTSIVQNDNITSDSYEMPAEHLILAIGHSARDTLEMLHQSGLAMQQKAFSAGVRIEHRQSLINRAQYGSFADRLPPADYKLAIHLPDGRGVYTFCMCPGGEIIAAASEDGCLVTNGMSYFKRNLTNGNSALLVGIMPEDFASDHPLAGIEFQRQLERAAFQAGGGGYIAPAQRIDDFLRKKPTTKFGEVVPSYRPGVKGCNLTEILPEYIHSAMRKAIPLFDQKLRGFAYPDAVMTGVETRSSSPVRILRDEHMNSNIEGILPCGEGCGYAGGIMSAAVDGIRCAERLINPSGGRFI